MNWEELGRRKLGQYLGRLVGGVKGVCFRMEMLRCACVLREYEDHKDRERLRMRLEVKEMS